MPYTNYTFTPKPSANFRSASQRFQPARSSTPGPIYDVNDDRGIGLRGTRKGSAPFVSETPRFKERTGGQSPSAFDYHTEGPPSYTRSQGGAAAFKSSTQRFPERRSTTPDPGMYDTADDRIIGHQKGKFDSMFRSQSERFRHKAVESPQAMYLGSYAPGDIGSRATSSTGKQSAAFRSTATRFKEGPRGSGPGLTSYLDVYETPRGSTRPTSVFRSNAERFPKPKVVETVSHYDINDPHAIGAARSRSPSAAFKSSTPRFNETRSSSPGMCYDIESATKALTVRKHEGVAAFKSKAPRFRESKASPTPTYDVRYPTDIAVEVERRARI